jgi:hypothetical protein
MHLTLSDYVVLAANLSEVDAIANAISRTEVR